MLKLTGNEKAVMGGLVTALVTTIAQLQQSGQLTLHEALVSLGSFVLAHLSVWLTANSPSPDAPVFDSPVDTPPAPSA